MDLPGLFTDRMQSLLGEEYDAFLRSFNEPRSAGLRINTLKWSVHQALEKLPFQLRSVEWTKEGFYYPENERPAKHPYYHAGLYYIQEPSAMAPGAVIPIESGDRVLDLCAAPGGKSTQVAARLAGRGILVSNDISSERIKALVKNIELFGIRNAIVTNESPQRLAGVFGEFFDKILIDAPCSGEGMFRKNPEMVHSWERHHIDACAAMQKHILDQAALMLKTGGMMLYSTCTFAPEENEQRIAQFLNDHPQFELKDIPLFSGFQQGRKEWSKSDHPLDKTIRLWPHHVRGEGHYLALLQKTGSSRAPSGWKRGEDKKQSIRENDLALFRQFERDMLHQSVQEMAEGELASFKGHLYLKPAHLPALQGLKVVKSGWYLGELKKNRFEPSQALAMGLNAQDVVHKLNFSSSDEDLYRYLKGETLFQEGKKGWKLITVEGYPLGWAKQVEGFLKNAYPPGWRRLA